MQLGNHVSAQEDVSAALSLEPNSPDALTLKLALDKISLAKVQQAAAAQKKAFGSFWGKPPASQADDSGNCRPKGSVKPLYQDKLAQGEAGAARIVCWMNFKVGEKDIDGRVVVELQPKWAPKAVENFRCLCTGERTVRDEQQPNRKDDGGCGADALCYAGSIIHRVCRGFVLQGGDTVYKHGERVGDGIASIYGGGFASEKPISGRAPKHLCPGLVALANDGRAKSNGCQFYVTMDAAPWLDDDFVVIGQVKEGMRTLRQIEALPVDTDDRPLERVEIVACGQLAEDELRDWDQTLALARKHKTSAGA